MGVKQVAAFTALLAAAAPSQANDFMAPQLATPGTMFYVSIPLGAAAAKDRALSYGLALQGKRQYETVYFDSRMLNFVDGVIAGIEVKWLIAGAVVVGAGAYAMRKDDDRSNSYSGSQNNQQNNNNNNSNTSNAPQQPSCDPVDPCKK